MNKTIHDAFLQIRKSANLQIRKFTLYSFLFLLSSFFSTAQNYDWDWKLNGGSGNGFMNEAQTNFDRTSEQIYDIKVGTDNNYYFLATVRGTYGVHLDGQPVTTNGNKTRYGNDIFLFSTTCDGTVRWWRAIGGGGTDEAYKLVLDSDNNIYIGAAYVKSARNWSEEFPVRFSETDSLPYPPANASVVSDFWKTAFLLKYDSDGQYVGKKAIQGDVDGLDYLPPQLVELVIDSQDQLHFIVGLRKGTGYLDGNVDVPNTRAGFQYYLAKYDSNLDYISSMELPIDDLTGFAGGAGAQTTRFAYDEVLNRYYIAGMRSAHIVHNIIPLTYDGKAFVERSYILAIDGSDGSEVWRREIYSNPVGTTIPSNQITSLIIDPATSDVYIAGQIYTSTINETVKIYDPNNPAATTYAFQPTVKTDIPIVIKFNSNGMVQWTKTPTAFASNYTSNRSHESKGLVLRYNEVVFGSLNSYFIWDSFNPNNPQFYQPDAALLRFNKQTGMTVGMDVIPGLASDPEKMLAIAVDNDGNYITGGVFFNGLFPDNNGLTELVGTGYSDFFVAKLAASVCGTAVGTEQFTTLKMNVYPNPTSDIVNIDTDEQLSNYIIYDVSGRQIQSHLFTGSNQINLQNVTTGVYFIKVITVQGNSGTVKVVKQ